MSGSPEVDPEFDPLTNTLRPLDDSLLTIRVIKSLTYRNFKPLILPHVDLTKTTVGQLKELVKQQILTQSGWKAFKGFVDQLDTMKIYTHAHGSKTTDLIINMTNPEWVLNDDSLTLRDVGIQNETEISFFNSKDFEEYSKHPGEIKW
ncbi:hypothetical protein BT69DRAFT_1350321 [Atractiella rhizophila]|nr:hypothetical protein BT69DRAFT_1350321 [Atractiella rhizophila]